ncbi:MAG TPA: hypothetical protein PKC69_12970 [Chitinophagaceae bacterium]|nr:hypothetical protein [Chitinophagaceae bacterium]
MRAFLSIALLIVFLFTHYERYITYLECRLAYYMSTAGEKCDCESLLADPGNASPGTAPSHLHVHPDDIYLPAFIGKAVSLSFAVNDTYRAASHPGFSHPYIGEDDKPPDFLS